MADRSREIGQPTKGAYKAPRDFLLFTNVHELEISCRGNRPLYFLATTKIAICLWKTNMRRTSQTRLKPQATGIRIRITRIQIESGRTLSQETGSRSVTNPWKSPHFHKRLASACKSLYHSSLDLFASRACSIC